jgi:hypothetical protein
MIEPVLQDPSVAQAPLEKKIAFLQSKNLTPEEVDVSLARVGDPPASSVGSVPPNYAYRQPPPPQAGYGGYPGGYWPQQPPPELPKRDWRDWFIMATVMGGVGYGIYFTAKVCFSDHTGDGVILTTLALYCPSHITTNARTNHTGQNINRRILRESFCSTRSVKHRYLGAKGRRGKPNNKIRYCIRGAGVCSLVVESVGSQTGRGRKAKCR